MLSTCHIYTICFCFLKYFKMAEISKMAFGYFFRKNLVISSDLSYLSYLQLNFGLIGQFSLLINWKILLRFLDHLNTKLPYKFLVQNNLFHISQGLELQLQPFLDKLVNIYCCQLKNSFWGFCTTLTLNCHTIFW